MPIVNDQFISRWALASRKRNKQAAPLRRTFKVIVPQARPAATKPKSRQKHQLDFFTDMTDAFFSMRRDIVTWFFAILGFVLFVRFGSDLSGISDALPAALKTTSLVKLLLKVKMSIAGCIIMLPSLFDYPGRTIGNTKVSRWAMAVMIIIGCFLIPECSVVFFSFQSVLLRMLFRTKLPSSFIIITISMTAVWLLSFTTTGTTLASNVATAVKTAATEAAKAGV